MIRSLRSPGLQTAYWTASRVWKQITHLWLSCACWWHPVALCFVLSLPPQSAFWYWRGPLSKQWNLGARFPSSRLVWSSSPCGCRCWLLAGWFLPHSQAAGCSRVGHWGGGPRLQQFALAQRIRPATMSVGVSLVQEHCCFLLHKGLNVNISLGLDENSSLSYT